jgi:Secretion system C-terminal sorting domain
MNMIIARRVLFLGLFGPLALAAFAQDGCAIRYRYDASGNRIARYWYCWTGDPDPDGTGDDKSMVDGGLTEHRYMAKSQLASVSLMVFPNPGVSIVSIGLSQAILGVGVIELVDAQGHVVLTDGLTGRSAELDVSTVANGNYFVRVRAGDEVLIAPLVVNGPE